MNDNQGSWRFPVSDGAELRGINASFDAKFRAARLRSLAREICQNSLDARNNLDEPVRLDFQKFDLPRQEFPGAEQYDQLLVDCLSYWKKRRADKGVKDSNEIRALSLAKKTLDQSMISVLRISDYNTTGVRPSKDEWDGLIRSSGLSFKPAGSNGSYGIGKAAPFACSDMLTVFYSTNSDEGRLSQGVAHFASFTDAAGQEHENVGYFCLGRNEPLPQELHLDPAFRHRFLRAEKSRLDAGTHGLHPVGFYLRHLQESAGSQGGRPVHEPRRPGEVHAGKAQEPAEAAALLQSPDG